MFLSTVVDKIFLLAKKIEITIKYLPGVCITIPVSMKKTQVIIFYILQYTEEGFHYFSIFSR